MITFANKYAQIAYLTFVYRKEIDSINCCQRGVTHRIAKQAGVVVIGHVHYALYIACEQSGCRWQCDVECQLVYEPYTESDVQGELVRYDKVYSQSSEIARGPVFIARARRSQ